MASSTDQKTVNNLLKHLEMCKEEALKKHNEKAANTLKKNNAKSPSRNTTGNRKRSKLTEVNQPNKISKWLSKPKLEGLEQKDQEKPAAKKATNKKPKEQKKLDDSFTKYGMRLPSFEKVMANRKKFADHKKKVEDLQKFLEDDVFQPIANKTSCTEEFSGKLLDCKHLSLDKIKEQFEMHRKELEGVINGDKFSERHQKFQDVVQAKSLTGSVSMMVFTHDQIDTMVNLMLKEFDPDDKLTRYFFQVLVPELALWIFMDCHNMTKDEATAYLDERPF